ncbi:hypothetical protein K1719_016243 [Acacia pycnantha]|nr:hypothetical protein K1719_016243 [Acacia pycnantha]
MGYSVREMEWWVMAIIIFILLGFHGESEGCLKEERQALLKLKEAFNYPNTGSYLPSWSNLTLSDCCTWEAVECDNSTKRVIRLYLDHTRAYELQRDVKWSLNASSFLPFQQLQGLDLSGNYLSANKGDPPPLPEDGLRSTKKVRIRPEGIGVESPVMEVQDVQMPEDGAEGEVSYRSKLLNLNHGKVVSHPSSEVVLSDGDYQIGQDGDVPSVEFFSRIREVLVKGMERTVILKLLGKLINYRELLVRTQALWQTRGSYKLVDMEGGFYFATFDLEEDYLKALTGGPWMIFGAYLTIQPWSLDFDSRASTISKVVVWARLPGLSFRYYHKSTLRVIGELLGDVIKIDYMTESRGRGRYARLAVLIDLQKPLVPMIKVDGRSYGVEYEGLPHICFACGMYGHIKDKCGTLTGSQGVAVTREPSAPSGAGVSSGTMLPDATASLPPDSRQSPYGTWMQVKYPKKGDKQRWGEEAKNRGSGFNGGSRYNVLYECEDLGENITQSVGTVSGARDPSGMKVKTMGSSAITNEDSRHNQGHGVSNVARSSRPWAKQGGPKIVQEFRKKSVGGVTLGPIRSEPIVDQTNKMKSKEPTPPSLGGVGLSILPNPGKEPIPLGVSTEGASESAVFLSSAFKALEASSPLASDKHTVVTLCSTIPVLDEANQMAVDAPMGSQSSCLIRNSGELAWESGFREVMVQVDCLVALNLVCNEKVGSSANGSLLRRIRQFLTRDWRLSWHHVYREGNRCADFIASFAVTLALGHYMLPVPPEGLFGDVTLANLDWSRQARSNRVMSLTSLTWLYYCRNKGYLVILD